MKNRGLSSIVPFKNISIFPVPVLIFALATYVCPEIIGIVAYLIDVPVVEKESDISTPSSYTLQPSAGGEDGKYNTIVAFPFITEQKEKYPYSIQY